MHASSQQSSALQSVCVFASRLLDPQCNTDRILIYGSRKESLHMAAEHKTPTVDASHDGPDAVPRSDAAGTGGSAAAHGTDAPATDEWCEGKAVTAVNHERI